MLNMYTCSDDGGKTFRSDLVQRIHGDYHALWINPANPDHLVLGSTTAASASGPTTAACSWDFVNNLAIGQFYEVGIDMRQPYWIYGGLQDNSTWGGPSRSMNPRGIVNADWFTVRRRRLLRPGGPEGSQHRLFAESQDGNLLRRDIRTGEQRSIKPQPAP